MFVTTLATTVCPDIETGWPLIDTTSPENATGSLCTIPDIPCPEAVTLTLFHWFVTWSYPRVNEVEARPSTVVDIESEPPSWIDRKSTRLNSSHLVISYAVFCL